MLSSVRLACHRLLKGVNTVYGEPSGFITSPGAWMTWSVNVWNGFPNPSNVSRTLLSRS